MVRQEQTALYLVRLHPLAPAAPSVITEEPGTSFEKAVESAPDCILITDAEGHLLAANPAFFRLAQLPLTQQVRGESLERWLGRSGIDLRVLISNLKKYGALRLFKTSFRGEVGASTDVEISAATVQDGDQPRLSFFIRDVGRRLSTEPRSGQRLPIWLEDLTERVGRAPLKELVRESTEQIERLCIDAALKLTGDNRASAAELLGLSRQSLYAKLARYDLLSSASEGGD
jgi:transcriptional regulator PpsR